MARKCLPETDLGTRVRNEEVDLGLRALFLKGLVTIQWHTKREPGVSTLECRQVFRMQLAILFLCILFALLYVSGLVLIVQLWLLSSRRSDTFAKPAERDTTLWSRAA